MKKILIFIAFIILSSCKFQSKKMEIFDSNVESISVIKPYSNEEIKMKNNFSKEIIKDLKNSVEIGPSKFAKPYIILIKRIDGKVDSIITNGKNISLKVGINQMKI